MNDPSPSVTLRGRASAWFAAISPGPKPICKTSITWFEAQNPRDERELAIHYAARASIRLARGDLAGAEADLQKSITWGEAQNPRNERSLALRYTARASIRLDRGDLAGAEADLQKSITWEEAQNPRNERSLATRYATRASIRRAQAVAARQAGETARAADLFRQAKTDIAAVLAWWQKNLPGDERGLAILRQDQARIEKAAGGE